MPNDINGMEYDAPLSRLVKAARSGKAEGRIWLIISGCLVSGKLTRFEPFKVIRPEWLGGHIQQEWERGQRMGHADDPVLSIELLDVQITIGATTIQKPWARINPDEVGAWGIDNQ